MLAGFIGVEIAVADFAARYGGTRAALWHDLLLQGFADSDRDFRAFFVAAADGHFASDHEGQRGKQLFSFDGGEDVRRQFLCAQVADALGGGGVVGHMGYRMFTSEKIFAQWQFGRVADYLLPPVQSFPTGRGEDLLWEWLSLYIHLSARCVCKWVCPVWGLCRCTAGVAPPLPNFPNPKQNSDAFCLGTRPLRTSPSKGGAFWTNTRLSFLFHHITG